MWMRLTHENILPFRGLDMTLFQLALVYDWGANGNICHYITLHPHASRASLVRDPCYRGNRNKSLTLFFMNGSCLMSREGWNTFIRSISHTGI